MTNDIRQTAIKISKLMESTTLRQALEANGFGDENRFRHEAKAWIMQNLDQPVSDIESMEEYIEPDEDADEDDDDANRDGYRASGIMCVCNGVTVMAGRAHGLGSNGSEQVTVVYTVFNGKNSAYDAWYRFAETLDY